MRIDFAGLSNGALGLYVNGAQMLQLRPIFAASITESER
jgi:hypothetical protein